MPANKTTKLPLLQQLGSSSSSNLITTGNGNKVAVAVEKRSKLLFGKSASKIVPNQQQLLNQPSQTVAIALNSASSSKIGQPQSKLQPPGSISSNNQTNLEISSKTVK